MITPGSVGVGEPSTITKRIDNVELTQPGPGGQDVERQAIALGDPEAWDRIAGVTDAAPADDALGLVVRPVGAPLPDNYDSGLIAVGDTPQVVTGQTTKVSTLLVVNDATTLRHLTLQDGAAGTYFTDMPLQAKQVLPLSFGGAQFANGVSVNVKSGQAAGVRVQVVGRQ